MAVAWCNFMIVQRFLQWAQTAETDDRARGTGALGRAYARSAMSADDALIAEAAMTALLDDHSLEVRKALAESIAASPCVPRHIIAGLCEDDAEVAAPVIALSPQLDTLDLVDFAASHDSLIQSAVAARSPLTAPVAAALAEVAGAEACAILVRNPDAVLTQSTMKRLVERFAANDDVREALLQRKDLPVHIQQLLVRAVAESLSSLVSGRQWMSRAHADTIAGQACEKATATLAAERRDKEDLADLVLHLRDTEQLTPGLLLRVLAEGNLDFFELALASVTNMPRNQVANLLRDRKGGGFDLIYRRVELPASARPAFRAGLDALFDCAAPKDAVEAGLQMHRRVSLMYAAQASQCVMDFDPVQALLRDLLAEASRTSARQVAEQVRALPCLTAA